jgi:hypothetical protein
MTDEIRIRMKVIRIRNTAWCSNHKKEHFYFGRGGGPFFLAEQTWHKYSKVIYEIKTIFLLVYYTHIQYFYYLQCACESSCISTNVSTYIFTFIHTAVPVSPYKLDFFNFLSFMQCCGSMPFWCGSGKVHLHHFSKIKS